MRAVAAVQLEASRPSSSGSLYKQCTLCLHLDIGVVLRCNFFIYNAFMKACRPSVSSTRLLVWLTGNISLPTWEVVVVSTNFNPKETCCLLWQKCPDGISQGPPRGAGGSPTHRAGSKSRRERRRGPAPGLAFLCHPVRRVPHPAPLSSCGG